MPTAITPAAVDSAVSDEQRARYDLDGFISYGRVLDAVQLRAMAERLDGICDGVVAVPESCLRFHADLPWGEATGVARRDAIWQLLALEQHDEVFRRLCDMPLIRAIIEGLVARPTLGVSSQVITKPAFHGAEVPWHQDSSYWGAKPYATCWIALDDATPANGCMRMIPGSHRRGQLTFTPTDFPGVSQRLLQTDGVNDDTQLYVPVKAGCATVHHPMTLHASSANTTAQRRRAIAITFELG